MDVRKKIKQSLPIIKQFFLFAILLSLVLLVNVPVISFDMMYPEQTIFYFINEKITSLNDLLTIYFHPQMLNISVPFFRPSGHFLIYKLITPFIGWHNTKALIVVNLFFLTVTGYFLIRFYQLLFPNFKVGGYIAFSLYLMHPALSLSRLTIMHFEFAYICCVTISLYLFAIFCQRNKNRENYHSFFLLMCSLFFYVFAVTWKESAIMLGPILAGYFCIYLYHKQPLATYFRSIATNHQIRKILLLLLAISITMGLYLSLQWPGF